MRNSYGDGDGTIGIRKKLADHTFCTTLNIDFYEIWQSDSIFLPNL